MYTPWKAATIAICLALFSSCAPAVHVVEGTITLDGKALPNGAIELHPGDDQSSLFGGDITDGSYRIEIPRDKAVGKTVVRITSMRSTGRKIPAGPPAPPGTTIDEIAEAIPDQYNSKSTLKIDLAVASPHNFDFGFPSQARQQYPTSNELKAHLDVWSPITNRYR